MISTTTHVRHEHYNSDRDNRSETKDIVLTSRFQACASDQESIDIRLLGQLLTVLLGNRTPVEDTGLFSCFCGYLFSQPFPNLVMDLLRLLCRGNFSCADRPSTKTY